MRCRPVRTALAMRRSGVRGEWVGLQGLGNGEDGVLDSDCSSSLLFSFWLYSSPSEERINEGVVYKWEQRGRCSKKGNGVDVQKRRMGL